MIGSMSINDVVGNVGRGAEAFLIIVHVIGVVQETMHRPALSQPDSVVAKGELECSQVFTTYDGSLVGGPKLFGFACKRQLFFR